MIRNERVRDLQTPVEEVVYVSLAQAPRRELKLIVRTHGDAAAVMPGIREAVRQIDPRLPLGDVRTMEQIKQRSLAGTSEPTWVIGAFAGIAAFLAALGLYGVLSHAVNQQRREIGIRMALGAGAGDVLSQVLRQAARDDSRRTRGRTDRRARADASHANPPLRGVSPRPARPHRGWNRDGTRGPARGARARQPGRSRQPASRCSAAKAERPFRVEVVGCSHSALWHTASMLYPSGSRTNAP